MNKNSIVILCLIFFGAFLFWLFPNDEKEIRSNLSQLAEFCSSTEGTASLVIISNVGNAAKLCYEPSSFDIESFDIKRELIRKEISQHLLMMKRMLPDTHFAFNDIQISFSQKDIALITTTVSLRGKTKNQQFTDAYEVDIVARKTDGDWLFSSFTVVEFMER